MNEHFIGLRGTFSTYSCSQYSRSAGDIIRFHHGRTCTTEVVAPITGVIIGLTSNKFGLDALIIPDEGQSLCRRNPEKGGNSAHPVEFITTTGHEVVGVYMRSCIFEPDSLELLQERLSIKEGF
jgi:hypothetical protein